MQLDQENDNQTERETKSPFTKDDNETESGESDETENEESSNSDFENGENEVITITNSITEKHYDKNFEQEKQPRYHEFLYILPLEEGKYIELFLFTQFRIYQYGYFFKLIF